MVAQLRRSNQVIAQAQLELHLRLQATAIAPETVIAKDDSSIEETHQLAISLFKQINSAWEEAELTQGAYIFENRKERDHWVKAAKALSEALYHIGEIREGYEPDWDGND